MPRHDRAHGEVWEGMAAFEIGEGLYLPVFDDYRRMKVVSIALDNLAPSPELEEILLGSWLGHPPDGLVVYSVGPDREQTIMC